MVLARFHFSPGALYSAVAARYGQAALEPGGLVKDPVDAVSLGIALMFGLLGLPHILMRFYTVPDARAARTSVLYATGFIGYFYLIIPIVGFGASALVGREIIRSVDTGGNMAAPLVAELLGGTPFLGFIAAVAFATILAVVAGLTLAGASALSHDIFTHAVRKGQASEQEQIRVARGATVAFGVLAVILGILFKGQNVAFMVGLAFAVAASANFPALLLSIVWRRFNTAGAVCSIVAGAAAVGRADRAQPDHLGRSAPQCARDLPAAQPRNHLDASRIPGRDRRLADRERAGSGSSASMTRSSGPTSASARSDPRWSRGSRPGSLPRCSRRDADTAR